MTYKFRPLADAAAPREAPSPALRTLSARLAFRLRRHELPALRGALVAHAGRDLDLLHNHLPGKQNYHYRYPLIQYRLDHGQAALFCIGEGSQAIRKVLQAPAATLDLNGRRVDLTVDEVSIDFHHPQVVEGFRAYELLHYLPLNQQHERTFRQLDQYARGGYLARLLTSHLLAFASGINWHVPERIVVDLDAVRQLPSVNYKGVNRYAFHVRFRCNLVLPEGIGLGKAVAMGYGVVKARRAS